MVAAAMGMFLSGVSESPAIGGVGVMCLLGAWDDMDRRKISNQATLFGAITVLGEIIAEAAAGHFVLVQWVIASTVVAGVIYYWLTEAEVIGGGDFKALVFGMIPCWMLAAGSEPFLPEMALFNVSVMYAAMMLGGLIWSICGTGNRRERMVGGPDASVRPLRVGVAAGSHHLSLVLRRVMGAGAKYPNRSFLDR